LPTYLLLFISIINTFLFLAKRAGDYYQFDYEPHLEEDITYPEEKYVEEVTPGKVLHVQTHVNSTLGAGEYDKLDPTQLLHTAIIKDLDLKKTLGSAQSAEKIKDEEKRMIEAVRDNVIKPKRSPKPSAKSTKTEDLDREAAELLKEARRKTEKEGLDAEEAARETLEEEGIPTTKEDGNSSDENDGLSMKKADIVEKEEGDEDSSHDKSDEDDKEDKTLSMDIH
jgi:hypothetical protein